MIRNFLLSLILLLGASAVVFAQEAVIIDIKGEVLVRKDQQSQWVNAQVNAPVGQDWSIKTVGDSTCILAFDTKRKNIVTVKDHTEVKVDNVLPGSIFLTEGRVFALIKNIKENKNFEVRTPTAISGARGTGWLTEVIAGETSISCFDDVVYVHSLDEAGEVTGEIDLVQGAGVDVPKEGVQKEDVKEVPPQAIDEWKGVLATSQEFALPEIPGPKSGDGKILPPATSGPNTQRMPPMTAEQQKMMAMMPVQGSVPPTTGEHLSSTGEKLLPPGEKFTPTGERPPVDGESHSFNNEGWGGSSWNTGPVVNDGFSDAQKEVYATLMGMPSTGCPNTCCPAACCHFVPNLAGGSTCVPD